MAEEQQSGTGQKVLVVEDEPLVRELAIEMLEDIGYRTVDAADGETAIKLLEEDPEVEILLTDVVLPSGTSGADVAAAAERLKPGIKILFMSGYTRDILARQGKLAAETNLLNKPFTIDQLTEKLRNLCS